MFRVIQKGEGREEEVGSVEGAGLGGGEVIPLGEREGHPGPSHSVWGKEGEWGHPDPGLGEGGIGGLKYPALGHPVQPRGLGRVGIAS